MIKLKNLLLEAVVMDMVMAEELATRIQKEVKVPFIQASVSTLGGKERPSVMVRLSLDPKREWENGIYQNSRYAQFHFDYEGTIEQFSTYGLSKKFRKARFKTATEAIKKLNTYIKQVQ